jgi:hypothetical protein
LGSVTTYTDLPGYPDAYVGSIGDAYIAVDTGHIWIWDGSKWQDGGKITGPQGQQGVQGGSGYQGTQGNFGPRGFQGFQGVQGVQGDVGLQGSEGLQGLQGNQGRQGTQGLQGRQGLQGLQGNQGLQGTQGIIGESLWAANQSGIHTFSNVGIGTSYQTEALEIAGNIKLGGQLILNDSAGISTVISSIGSDRFLQNLIIDCGSF